MPLVSIFAMAGNEEVGEAAMFEFDDFAYGLLFFAYGLEFALAYGLAFFA